MTNVSHTYFVRRSEPRVCDTFDILTFAISIVDILTFRHYDFDIVTVDIFTVDLVTCHPLYGIHTTYVWERCYWHNNYASKYEPASQP